MHKYTFTNCDNDMLFKAIVGSKAYGLDTPTSDTDIRGIYLQPNEYLLALGYQEQHSDAKNDITYYELNRFLQLLKNNNPNIIELLFTPKDKMLVFNEKIMPLYEKRYDFLTTKIKQSFGGYAIAQIKKARGMNKKIVKPMAKEKKTPLDFCYIIVPENGYVVSLSKWLSTNNYDQNRIGLSSIKGSNDLFKVYYDVDNIGFRGIVKDNSDELRQSEIPKEYPMLAMLRYNNNGYSLYCKEYKDYFDWVEKRNPHRYNDNISHNQNYDGKNMMHCIRILDMAIEIGNGEGVNILRPDRDWLLSIRRGEVTYDYLINLIEEKNQLLNDVFDNCNLPSEVSDDLIHDIILQIRKNN